MVKKEDCSSSSMTTEQIMLLVTQRTVETYLNSVNNYNHEHNMVQRISQLFKNHKDMHRDKVRKALIKWDLDQGRVMISAELSLRTPTKPYQWSPQLRNAGILLRYWKLRLKEVQQTTTILKRLQNGKQRHKWLIQRSSYPS